MIRVTVQMPPNPDKKFVSQLEKSLWALTEGKGEVIVQQDAAPAATYGVTVHLLPDPEKPAEPEE